MELHTPIFLSPPPEHKFITKGFFLHEQRILLLTNAKVMKPKFAQFSSFVLAKIRRIFVKSNETSHPQTEARIRTGQISTKRYFAGNGSKDRRVVMNNTFLSDRYVCCNCLKRSFQIERSSMLVIVKPALVKKRI